MEWVFGEYRINNDKSFLSIQKIKVLLDKSYWGSQRSLETIEIAIKNSDCFGIYFDKEQVGFARVVSDKATMFWLCDVIIDERHRGKELGKKLVKCILESEEYKDLRGILATRDAHGLYEKYGFEKAETGRFMIRPQYQ